MASLSPVWIGLLLLSIPVGAYLDHGDATLPRIETHIPTIPHHLSRPEHARVTGAGPSMISAIAPIVTDRPDGGQDILYSIYYHEGAPESQNRVGRGVFKRGVFSGDPPFPTCTPCDGSGTGGFSSTYNSSTGFSTEPACKTVPYNGAFKSRDPRSTSYCFGSSYSGIFSTEQPYSYTLPCCFTTPASCLANGTSSTSTSYSFTSGVFASTTTFTRNFTVSTFTAPPSSSFTLPSSTRSANSTDRSGSTSRSTASGLSYSGSLTASASSSSTRSLLSMSGSLSVSASSSSARSLLSVSGSLSASASSSSAQSLRSVTSASAQSGTSTSSFSIIVISSTTITLSAPVVSSTTTPNSVITVITITSSSSRSNRVSTTFSPAPTTAFATVIGCGTVTSGSGTVNGSGTVYPTGFPFLPVTSVGVASGSAILVIGCGILIGTGTFTGSASITGCGEGNGTAVLTGTGTVWPDIANTPQTTLSITSSGTISGRGRVKGCGTLTGSGTFSITDVYTITPTSTRSRSFVIVETYVSYCGLSTASGGGDFGLNRIADNGTSEPAAAAGAGEGAHLFNISAGGSGVKPAGADDADSSPFHNDTLPINPWVTNGTTGSHSSPNATNSSSSSEDPDLDNPGCIACPNSGGICCPIDHPCDAQGKCPWAGIVAGGYVRFGYNMVMARNMSDGTQISDGGISPEAAGLGRVQSSGDRSSDDADGELLAGGGGGVLGGLDIRPAAAAPHPMGGNVGSVLAKREREAEDKRRRERADMQRRGLVEAPHDFVVIV